MNESVLKQTYILHL
uniref:Uncharacterized protein n=1 Tax=Anguilla anguilla TaxID=7936 RepID=A0A0E9V332_ANGAN